MPTKSSEASRPVSPTPEKLKATPKQERENKSTYKEKRDGLERGIRSVNNLDTAIKKLRKTEPLNDQEALKIAKLVLAALQERQRVGALRGIELSGDERNNLKIQKEARELEKQKQSVAELVDPEDIRVLQEFVDSFPKLLDQQKIDAQRKRIRVMEKYPEAEFDVRVEDDPKSRRIKDVAQGKIMLDRVLDRQHKEKKKGTGFLRRVFGNYEKVQINRDGLGFVDRLKQMSIELDRIVVDDLKGLGDFLKRERHSLKSTKEHGDKYLGPDFKFIMDFFNLLERTAKNMEPTPAVDKNKTPTTEEQIQVAKKKALAATSNYQTGLLYGTRNQERPRDKFKTAA